jgi:hypothetical protein
MARDRADPGLAVVDGWNHGRGSAPGEGQPGQSQQAEIGRQHLDNQQQ